MSVSEFPGRVVRTPNELPTTLPEGSCLAFDPPGNGRVKFLRCKNVWKELQACPIYRPIDDTVAAPIAGRRKWQEPGRGDRLSGRAGSTSPRNEGLRNWGSDISILTGATTAAVGIGLVHEVHDRSPS
jgi:hypothetical protein